MGKLRVKGVQLGGRGAGIVLIPVAMGHFHVGLVVAFPRLPRWNELGPERGFLGCLWERLINIPSLFHTRPRRVEALKGVRLALRVEYPAQQGILSGIDCGLGLIDCREADDGGQSDHADLSEVFAHPGDSEITDHADDRQQGGDRQESGK